MADTTLSKHCLNCDVRNERKCHWCSCECSLCMEATGGCQCEECPAYNWCGCKCYSCFRFKSCERCPPDNTCVNNKKA